MTLVQRQYDRLAVIYDQRWQGYVTNTLAFLKTWAAIQPQEAVLDVACGTGAFEQLLLAENPEQAIAGIDFSEQMLAVAREKCRDYRQVTFQSASAEALPFSPQAFEVVVCANAFHYFEQPGSVLSEMERVLKPGGRVVILDWCRDFWVCQLYDWLLKIIDPGHRQCYTQAELHGFLKATNYQITASQRMRFGWIWGLMVVTAVPQR